MAIVQARFRVHLKDGTSHDLDIIFGDTMRGELEAHKNGLPTDVVLGLHMATIYAWCAMQRLGLLEHTVSYAIFKETMIDGLDKLKEPVPVDPSQTGPSAPPSD